MIFKQGKTSLVPAKEIKSANPSSLMVACCVQTNVKCPPELSNFPELQINTLQIEAQRPLPQV